MVSQVLESTDPVGIEFEVSLYLFAAASRPVVEIRRASWEFCSSAHATANVLDVACDQTVGRETDDAVVRQAARASRGFVGRPR